MPCVRPGYVSSPDERLARGGGRAAVGAAAQHGKETRLLAVEPSGAEFNQTSAMEAGCLITSHIPALLSSDILIIRPLL